METEASNFVLSDAKMKELTTIESLLKPEVSSQIGLIKQHVENGFPVDFSFDGWNFLHTACFVGNSDLLEFLLQRAKEKGGDVCRKMLNQISFQDYIEPDSGINWYNLPPMQLTLIRHVKYYGYKICKLLVDYGADVNIVDNYGCTPLLTACKQQTEFTVELCKLLINSGADVKFVDKDGCTPLHTACTSQTEFTIELCKLLINCGADVKFGDKDVSGCTPLHTACTSQTEFTVELCKLLINSGADVKFVDKDGCTPLHTACTSQTEFTVELCKLLINSGAGVKFVDKDGCTPLLTACKKQTEFTIEVCKLLIDCKADVHFQDKYGNITLHHVFNSSFVLSDSEKIKNVSQFLLDSGANINTKNNNDENPTVCLIKNIQLLSKNKTSLKTFIDVIGMFKFLTKAGADLLIRTHKHSQTLYHNIVELAIELYSNMSAVTEMNGEKESQILSKITELLALLKNDKGTASINSRDEGGNTPLHLACKLVQNHCNEFFQSAFDKRSDRLLISLVDSLTSCGSNVNAVNDKQETPLHLVSTGDAIKSLLQLGAKPNVWDDNGNTPVLQWMLEENDSKLAELCFSIEDLTVYFKQGLDPFLVDDNGDTVLQVLLSNKKFVCAQNLIKAVVGVDADNAVKKDENGDTFLHVVCKCDDDRVQGLIEFLLQSCADPIVENEMTGETPLHVLCRRITQTKSDNFMFTSSAWAVRVLREKGADLEAADLSGKTCLDIAIDNRHSELQEILESSVEGTESSNLLRWEKNSVEHTSMLAQVERHQNSKQVGIYHYHNEPIGAGTFGHVHVGISEQDGQEIAVKRIKSQHLCRPEDEREINNLLRLRDCKQVIKYQTYHKDEHFLYIILELMDGSLDKLTCFEKNHVDLCRDVISGIVFLHNNGVLHRDIKPGNILYKSQPDRPHLKLADFGLSKNLDSNLFPTDKTVMHSKAFTRCYSPAEILTKRKHSEASDIFSAGLVLHYILADKKHPFGPRDGRDLSNADSQHATEGRIRLGQLNLCETLSPEANHLLLQMLQHYKNDRPTATDCLSCPFFWSKKKKKDFLCAVGNQTELQKSFDASSSSGHSSVESDLEGAFKSEFSSRPWDTKIPGIYMEMAKNRRYLWSSAVDLLRFIRNSYAHCSESQSKFQKNVLDEFVYFDKFPTLAITVYDIVMKHGWNSRKEISKVLS